MDFFEPFNGGTGITRGGVAGFNEIADAAFDETLMLRNVGGEGQAYLRAYGDINRKVKEGFGIDLPNPITDWQRFDPKTGRNSLTRLPERTADAENALRGWHAERMRQLQAQDPARFRELGLDQDLEARVTDVMRTARIRSEDVDERTQGFVVPLLAQLWGGLKALPYDPVQVAALPLGGGSSIPARIAIAGAVNAGAEAISYPLTTDQKRRGGMEPGVADFVGEVATAAAFGAGLQGAGEGAAALFKRWRGSSNPAERGAALQLDADDAMVKARPAAVPEAEHVRTLNETMRYIEEPGAPAPIFPDPVPEGRPVLPDAFDVAAAQPVASFSYLDKPVERRRVDPMTLGFEPDRFQYKGGGDARGVTDRLGSVEKWDDMAAQAIVAYEYADGRIVVADGHQRTGLAQRLMTEGREKDLRIDAFVLRERDGWTADEAFAVATRRNLQQGTGDVTDTAVALQRLPGILDKTVARGSAHMRTAQGLAKLDPELLGMVRAGVLSQEAGKVIGYKLNDPAQQRAAVDAIQRLNLKGEETISGFIDELKAASVRSETTFDLFGDQEIARSLAVEMAELKVKVADLLKQNAKAFKRVNEAADVLEARRNVLVRDVNARVADSSRDAAAFVQSLSIDPGPLRDIIMDGARRMAAGDKIAKVARDVSNTIADLAEREGMDGLVPRAPATVEGVKAMTPKISDPVGPEVKARADALERRFRDEEASFKAIARSADYKAAVKAYNEDTGKTWSVPHPESAVAREFAAGVAAGRANLPVDPAQVPEFTPTGPGAFNPMNPYLQGYEFARTGMLIDIRSNMNAAYRDAALKPAAPTAAAEAGADGMPQLLLDGVPPVRDAERLQLEASRPMRGGDAPPPEGGLFDTNARDQGGLFDSLPGLDDGRWQDGAQGGGAPRTRQQLVDDLNRLDAENTLLDACVKK